MKAFSRIVAAGALLGVSGCTTLPEAGLGGTFVTEPFIKATLGGGNSFASALAREYQALASDAAYNDVNWMDASAYMVRGRMALGGNPPAPWTPAALGLTGEAVTVYDQVVAAIAAGRPTNPVACAKLQAAYDHWLEELSEGDHACTDPALIYAELQDHLAACLPPPPKPPVVIPPKPPVVYVPEPQPEPVYVPYVEPEPICPACEPRIVEVPGPERIVEKIVEVPGPERVVIKEVIKEVQVPGPERIVQVPGPERIVEVPGPERIVEVPGPERIVNVPGPERIVEVPGPVQYVDNTPTCGGEPMRNTIYFGFDRYDLTAEARAVIDQVVDALGGYCSPLLSVIGHTDTSGNKAYNQRLSERRSAAVASALSARGVSQDRIRVEARSELNPAVSSGDSVREALNRRVDIEVRDQ